jgi:RNA polymerase-interacting CarD/CdnL/TRCF family regulator
MTAMEFHSGDQVLHPRFGLGVIDAIQTRDDAAGAATRYYHIRLAGNGMLFVPVATADALGLRLLVNSLAAIVASLHSAARALPSNGRERVALLRKRWDAPDPAVLAETMRDLLGFGRQYRLSASDKQWLTRAGARLCVEAAVVDAVEPAVVSAAIARAVSGLKAQLLGAPAPGGRAERAARTRLATLR